MLKIEFSGQFKRDYKLTVKTKNIDKMFGMAIMEKYKQKMLKGKSNL